MGSLFCLWQLISLQGSSLFAPHAYHKAPTGAILDYCTGLLSVTIDTFWVCWLSLHPLYCIFLYKSTAVLRDISAGTSYQVVRLVFRPYAHLLPTSWTSVWLRSSIRIFPDFNQGRHSSLPFGSYDCNLLDFSRLQVLSLFVSLQSKSPWSVFQYGS